MPRRMTIWILIVITICNLPPIKWIFLFFDHDDYRYSNIDGWFTYEEFQFKGRDFKMGQRRFEDFKEQCKCGDTILYKLNKNNFLKFWRYSDYLFRKKYHLPYQEWSIIEARRNKRQKHSIEYTDF